jgi:hypothetical protein
MTAMLIACPLIVVLGHRFHHLSQATYVLGSVILVFSAFSIWTHERNGLRNFFSFLAVRRTRGGWKHTVSRYFF